jgi:hypothetical protein
MYYSTGNLLHWPAGIVPVSHVRSDEQFYPANNDLPTNQRCVLAAKARTAMQNSEGLPVCAQVSFNQLNLLNAQYLLMRYCAELQ